MTKRFGHQVVLDDVNWNLESGVRCAVLGPSGAGKTTLLRIVAGLEQIDSGKIDFRHADGSAEARPSTGMVFQDLGLWPHLTAAQHIECVLKGGSRADRKQQAKQRLAEVRLPKEAWAKRPAELSGGESQRVAIARAIAIRPDLLLLDEPLAQVDTSLRSDLISLFREVAAATRPTIIYVTHSWFEASLLAEEVAVLVDGSISQAGRFKDVFHRPASGFIAKLTGPVIEIPQQVIADGALKTNLDRQHLLTHGDRVVIRPQQFVLTEPTESNRWKVVENRLAGTGWQVTLNSGQHWFNAAVREPLCQDSVIGIEVVGM